MCGQEHRDPRGITVSDGGIMLRVTQAETFESAGVLLGISLGGQMEPEGCQDSKRSLHDFTSLDSKNP